MTTARFLRYHFRIISLVLVSACVILSMEVTAQQKDSTIYLPGIEVTGNSMIRNMPAANISQTRISQQTSGDLGEILRKESNVSGIRRGGYAIDPVVRGFRYSQISVFLDDGIHIEGGCPNRMDPVLSHIEPELIRQIQIIKGPYLLEFGPVPSASIRLVTRPDETFFSKGFTLNSISGYDVNRNGIKQHLALSQSGEDYFFKASGGFKSYGNYTDGNGREWNSEYHKKDIAVDAGIKAGKMGIAGISYKGAFGRNVLFPALPMDELTDNTHIFSAYLQPTRKIDSRPQVSASVWHSRVYHLMGNKFRPQYSQVVPPLAGIMQAEAWASTSSTGGRIGIHYLKGKTELKHGLDFRSTSKDGTREMKMIMNMEGQEFTSVKRFNLWKDARINNMGLFTTASFDLQKINISASARVDFNLYSSGDTLAIETSEKVWFDSKPGSHILFSGAVNVSIPTGQNSRLIAGIARSQRPADMQERYLKFLATGYDRYDYLGNPELKPETNIQTDLIFEYSPDKMKFHANIFRSVISNFIAGTLLPPSVARPVSQGAPGVKQFNNLEKAEFIGFEASFAWEPVKNAQISIASGYTYAWFHSVEKIIIENGGIAGIENLTNDPLPEMPAFETEINLNYKFRKPKIKSNLGVRMVSSQNQISDAAAEEKTPGYILADISLIYAPVRVLTIQAGINNLFDKAYYDHLNRKIIGQSERLYEPGRTFFVNVFFSINRK